MATTVTELTIRAIETNSYDALSTTVGIIVIGALVILLVEREALTATEPRGRATSVGPVIAIIVPLVAPWALTISVRLINLL